MIFIASCGHFPDDERIYHLQIQTLCELDIPIKYFSYSNSNISIENNQMDINSYNNSISQSEYFKIILNTATGSPPKIFHIHDLELLPVAKKLKQKYNTKIIYDVHEDLCGMWDTFSSKTGLLKLGINSWLSFTEKLNLNCVDQFILANRLARKSCYNSYAPIEIIENFPKSCRAIPLIKLNTPMKLIYHGQLADERGTLELIRAVILISKTQSISLQLLGNSRTVTYENKILSEISDVSFINWEKRIPYHEVWEYLYNSDMGVLPFKDVEMWKYNTPTKLFEYMASGCAIVASDLPPIREYASDSIAWCKPGSVESLVAGILKFIDLNNFYNESRDQNLTLFRERFNWEIISIKLKKIYGELLN